MTTNNKKPEAADIHIGRRVQERRKAINMSQEKLGEHLGITFQQVQKYEKGANRISAGRLFTVAGALNTPVGFFYEGLDEGTDAPQGFAEGEGQPALSGAPDASDEIRKLEREFRRIVDPTVRRAILDLVRTVAEPSGGSTRRPRKGW